jgi:hypothetical protein
VAIILGLMFLIPVVPGVKMSVHRDRPRTLMQLNHVDTGQQAPFVNNSSGYSFPSGDTATVFVVVGVLLAFSSPWFVPPAVSLAGFVGALRIFTLNHYLSDVAAGAVIGLIGGAIAVALIKRHVSDSFLRQQNRIARWAGGIGVVALIVLEAMIHHHSSILIFLKVYGPAVVLAVLWWERVQKNDNLRRGRFENADPIGPVPPAAEFIPSPEGKRDSTGFSESPLLDTEYS